jgi:hypothetical protein
LCALSARTADIVFSVVNGDKPSAKAAYDSLKQLLRLQHTTRFPRYIRFAILPLQAGL